MMRELFDELEPNAKSSLGNMIGFLLDDEGSDADIHYHDNPEQRKKLEKIRKILLSLPEKSYMHNCKIIQEKTEKQQQLSEALSIQDIGYTEEEVEEVEYIEHK
jgi:uncharacterized protein YjcR